MANFCLILTLLATCQKKSRRCSKRKKEVELEEESKVCNMDYQVSPLTSDFWSLVWSSVLKCSTLFNPFVVAVVVVTIFSSFSRTEAMISLSFNFNSSFSILLHFFSKQNEKSHSVLPDAPIKISPNLPKKALK